MKVLENYFVFLGKKVRKPKNKKEVALCECYIPISQCLSKKMQKMQDFPKVFTKYCIKKIQEIKTGFSKP